MIKQSKAMNHQEESSVWTQHRTMMETTDGSSWIVKIKDLFGKHESRMVRTTRRTTHGGHQNEEVIWNRKYESVEGWRFKKRKEIPRATAKSQEGPGRWTKQMEHRKRGRVLTAYNSIRHRASPPTNGDRMSTKDHQRLTDKGSRENPHWRNGKRSFKELTRVSSPHWASMTAKWTRMVVSYASRNRSNSLPFSTPKNLTLTQSEIQ